MHYSMHAGYIVAAALVSSTVLAQDVEPAKPAMPISKWMTQEEAGQWRASKLIGLTVYNKDGEKVGGITELIVDKSGKVDAVVVGAGGFLGLGEHDVAIPYSDISWSYLPGTQSRATTPPVSSNTPGPVDKPAEGAHPSADKAFVDAASARPYPDHAVINLTKEQLKAGPAFKFSR
jgi:sporulation protein YlmC with PRC-barrel domain